jgi:hypothetical protein
VIYVYAVVDEPGPPLDGLRGLADTRLFCISEGPVAAVCSTHLSFDAEPDAANLWRHEHVTAGLMARGTVAPVRFGTMVDDVGPLRELLVARCPHLVAALHRLRGKVELALRASMPAATPDRGPRVVGASEAEASPGRAYLRARRRECSDLDPTPAALTELHAALSASADAATISTGPGTRIVASYLVGGEEVASFRQAVARARHRVPEMRVSVTGPWAGYSFVDSGVLAGA